MKALVEALPAFAVAAVFTYVILAAIGLPAVVCFFVALVLGGSVGITTAIFTSAARYEAGREQRIQDEVRRHFDAHPDHRNVLRQIHERSIFRDEFGDLNGSAWNRKLNEYIRDKMGHEPEIIAGAVYSHLLDYWVAEGSFALPDARVATDIRDGIAYELVCLAILEDAGFLVNSTARSGDQGADLIAIRGVCKLAIQCKDYSKPVGNEAVMQVEAARQFYDCTHAVVVTSAGFTNAARQLARKIGVALLHTDDLGAVDEDHLPAPPG